MRATIIPIAAIAAALLGGCGGEAEPRREAPPSSKLMTRWTGGPGPSRPDDPRTGADLPGPPGSAASPTSSDPEVRAVEDRLFKTDGGRVVLRAIRVQGGWRSWIDAREILAEVRDPTAAAGAPAAGIAVPVSDPPAVPPSPDARRLAAPFWMAAPGLRLEYSGVVVDSGTGETYDMVEVSGEGPDGALGTAYFSRRSGFLARLVEPPPATDGIPAAGFVRVDFGGWTAAEGLRLAGRWAFYRLPDRFARVALDRPDAIRVLAAKVDPRPREGAAP